MGIPFAAFVLSHRLHGTAIALSRDEASLTAITTIWGTDAAHFSHAGAYRQMAERG